MNERSYFWANRPCDCELPGGRRLKVHNSGRQRYARNSWKHFVDLPLHKHNELHIVVLTDGENKFHYADQEVDWAAPTGVLIDSNILHDVRPIQAGSIEYLQITFSVLNESGEIIPYTWSQLSQDVGGRAIDNETIRPETSQKLIPDLLAGVNAVVEGDALTLNARLLAILAGLNSTQRPHIPEPLKHIQDIVAQDPAFEWDIDALSQASGWSTGYLHRCCRATLDCTPMDLVYQLRLEKACALLVEGSLNLNAIAEICGFVDAYHFSRRFKQRYGLPPGAWRKQKVDARQ